MSRTIYYQSEGKTGHLFRSAYLLLACYSVLAIANRKLGSIDFLLVHTDVIESRSVHCSDLH